MLVRPQIQLFRGENWWGVKFQQERPGSVFDRCGSRGAMAENSRLAGVVACCCHGGHGGVIDIFRADCSFPCQMMGGKNIQHCRCSETITTYALNAYIVRRCML